MSGLKIDLKELELFKQQLKNDISLERLIPDITIAVERFANRFETRFQQVYKTNLRLEDLRIGGKVKPSEVGKTYLRYGLQYRFKPTELADFPYLVVPSRSFSVAHIFEHRARGQFSKGIVSKVTKKKGSFKIDRLSGRKVFIAKGKLLTRSTDETWISKPKKGFKGERAEVQVAVGPPLNILAGGLIEHDTQVQVDLGIFETDLIKIFTDFYVT